MVPKGLVTNNTNVKYESPINTYSNVLKSSSNAHVKVMRSCIFVLKEGLLIRDTDRYCQKGYLFVI